jgi:hypothetical protein
MVVSVPSGCGFSPPLGVGSVPQEKWSVTKRRRKSLERNFIAVFVFGKVGERFYENGEKTQKGYFDMLSFENSVQ